MRKVFEKGLAEDDCCCICGQRGTQWHRLLECPCSDALRMQLLGLAGRQVLRRLGEFSERCLEQMLPPAAWFHPVQIPEGHKVKNER
eukprot:1985210-Amphidinium_carterae.1